MSLDVYKCITFRVLRKSILLADGFFDVLVRAARSHFCVVLYAKENIRQAYEILSFVQYDMVLT